MKRVLDRIQYTRFMVADDSNASLAIDLHDVRKIYSGNVEALRGIRMQARRGEIFGLLGPNGAGKSTLVKIMLTVVRPTEARGTILGQPIGHTKTLARVGYLPEKHRFPEYLTGRQAIEFAGAMSGAIQPGADAFDGRPDANANASRARPMARSQGSASKEVLNRDVVV